MKSALVVDSNKVSLLMTAEACKDVKTDKIEVDVAYSGLECLKKIEENSYDFIIVDFDLPDCDGVSLIKEIKKIFYGPTLLTAFSDPAVTEAINRELYWYEDVGKWLKKPINTSDLKALIDHFVFQKRLVTKRFAPKISANISIYEKSSKKIEISGVVLSMTINNLSIKYTKNRKFAKSENIVMRLFPSSKKTKVCSDKGLLVRGTVEWVDPETKEIGLTYRGLSLSAQKNIEAILKNSLYLEESLVPGVI